MSKEPIYDESCLACSDNPAQTLYNCRCMLRMLGMEKLEGCEMPGEAAVGFGLVLHQVSKALLDLDERYVFVDKKPD